MRGNPKTLNSKYDYEYVKKHCDVSYWLPRWENLLATRYTWLPGDMLDKKEDGIEDETHKIETYTNEVDGQEVTTYQQINYVEDQASDFVRFGFTLEEVNAAIAEGKKLINDEQR